MRDKSFMINFKQVAGLISVLALIVPTPAQAQTWIVGENEGAVRYVDATSIKRHDDFAIFRVKGTYSHDSEYRGKSFISYRIINCSSGNWTELRSKNFDREGYLIDDYTSPKEEIEIYPTRLDSLSEDIYSFVC